MQFYQLQKNNPYKLPDDIYMQAIYAVRGYDRMKKQISEIPHESATTFSTYTDSAITATPEDPTADQCRFYYGHGSTPGNPTEEKAMRIEALSKRCEAIEQALTMIPSEYRRGVMTSVLERGSFQPYNAHPNTYSRWRCRFLWYVANNLSMI